MQIFSKITIYDNFEKNIFFCKKHLTSRKIPVIIIKSLKSQKVRSRRLKFQPTASNFLTSKRRSRLARFMAHDWNSCMG